MHEDIHFFFHICVHHVFYCDYNNSNFPVHFSLSNRNTFTVTSWVTQSRSGYLDFSKPSRRLMFKAAAKINLGVHHSNYGPTELITFFGVSFFIFRRTNTHTKIALWGGECAHDLTLGTTNMYAKSSRDWPSHFTHPGGRRVFQ